MKQKKHILYVDKDYLPGAIGYDRDVYIRRELEKKHDLTLHRCLDNKVIDLISQTLSDRKFDAMITNMPYRNVPYSFSYLSHLKHISEMVNVRKAYQHSLDILKNVKKLVDMPIIIYTGAGNSASVRSAFWEVGDQIVHKSTSNKQDFQDINSALKRLLKKYKNFSPSVKEPDIKIKDGYTTTQVQVNLNGGLDLMSVGTIFQECKDFSGKILFKSSGRAHENKKVYNGKMFLDLLMPPNIQEGQNLTICVEGLGAEVQRLVQRLYVVLSSRYWFDVDFKRFETEMQK